MLGGAIKLGRHEKVLEEDHIDRRELGYYFTPDFVANYISERLLTLNPNGSLVLDPCCGCEELIDTLLKRGMSVDGLDVEQYKENYACNFHKKDFISYYEEMKAKSESRQMSHLKNEKRATSNLALDYDYIIANPPYNCHEVDYIKDNKAKLKNLFSDVGVHNMYSMFISAIIDMAKSGALIGLITFDSFFTAKAHTNLRRKILDTCTIHEITMCPNDLFHDQDADVRTSILILQKDKKYQRKVKATNRPLSKKAFKQQLTDQLEVYRDGRGYHLNSLILTNKKDNDEFIIECPDDIKYLFSYTRLGEEYKCITGISTGQDELYLSKEQKDPFTIPFYKNPGKNRFFTDNHLFLHKDFLQFDKEISNFMVRNKKLLYQSGITCSSMGVAFTAAKLPKNATYGVNANIICEDDEAWWLLAYLNSELVTYLVRGILIRSNMITSGYVSRIPLITIKREDKQSLRTLAKQAYERAERNESYQNILDEINVIVNNNANISLQTVKFIKNFNFHLIKNT